MRKLALLFLFGFVATYVPLIYFFAKVPSSVPDALAEDNSEDVIKVVLQTLEPTGSPESAVLASADEEINAEPTKSPEPTPKSTPEPSMAPTETPEPTPAPTETPVPVPTATPDVYAHPPYDGWIAQYAGQYGIDRNLLDRIAQCESQFNPSIVSPNGKYVGLFQFSVGTWQTYRGPNHLNLDTNPDLRSNPEEAIRTAAYLISKQGVSAWPLCLN